MKDVILIDVSQAGSQMLDTDLKVHVPIKCCISSKISQIACLINTHTHFDSWMCLQVMKLVDFMVKTYELYGYAS